MGRKPKNGYNETDTVENSNGYYSIPASEQETVIVMLRSEDTASISTSDTTMKTKLDKLCDNNPDYYFLESDDGYYKNYICSDKSLISFRAKKREMSDEAKAAASERFKELHKEGKIGRKKKENPDE